MGVVNQSWLTAERVNNWNGTGETFFVCNINDTAVVSYLTEKIPGDHLFVASAAAADVAIQAALDSCVSNRGDTVIIWPSEVDYDLAATLTMSKKAVHLVCPHGLGNDIGATNAARIHQNGAYPIITVAQSSVEIAGFYFKNYAQYSGIYAATSVAGVGVYGCNIHHNTFTMRSTTTAAQPMICFNGDAGAWGSIESNWFITAVSNATYTSIIQIESSATSARVKHNEITIGDGCTATIGIFNNAVKGVTADNIFSECGGIGVTPSGGAIGAAVFINANGAAINNYGAVATGHLMAGGTAGNSFVRNTDGKTGTTGDNGLVTNLET
jgi:hypothetical protein